MKTELEAELSEAFAARAARVPVVAATRLRSTDYRPRERRLRAPATVGAGVLAGAATAGTVLAVVLGGGVPAYAGWSPTPASDSGATSPDADSGCLSQLASMASGPAGSSAGSGAWDNVLTDVRGPFTVALFQDAGAYAACFTSSSFTEVNQISTGGGAAAASGSVHVQRGSVAGGTTGVRSGGMSQVSLGGTSSGSLQQVMQNHLRTSSDGPYTLVDGRTQSGVTGVTLVRDDGQDVVATVADGWFVAWWPGASSATAAEVTTSSGTSTEPLVQRTLPAPPSLPEGGSGSASPGATSNSGNTGTSANTGTSGNTGSGPSTSTNP
jgi:hypothetical protein